MSSSFENADKNTASNQFDLEYLYQQYYSRLCYYAYTIIGDQGASKDIVQDAFVKYWHSQKKFDSITAIRNFLYVSVRNACLNQLRHLEVTKKYADQQEAEPASTEFGLEQIIRAEVIGEIQKAIETLPDGCRSVLKLAFMEGLKNDDIAAELGISVNTVKSQKQRAVQLLRLKLNFNALLLLMTILHQ